MSDVLPHSLELWDNAARLGLPLWLKAWLGVVVLTALTSLVFVRRHVAARWVIGGFVLSHLLVVVIEFGHLAVLRKGLVSWTHVIGWTPALVAVAREWSRVSIRAPYGLWCRAMVFLLGVSLLFDYRDAFMYLYYLSTGHPAFGDPPP